jgi:hypothetical protein
VENALYRPFTDGIFKIDEMICVYEKIIPERGTPANMLLPEYTRMLLMSVSEQESLIT